MLSDSWRRPWLEPRQIPQSKVEALGTQGTAARRPATSCPRDWQVGVQSSRPCPLSSLGPQLQAIDQKHQAKRRDQHDYGYGGGLCILILLKLGHDDQRRN